MTYYVPGDWNATCWVCGHEHKASKMRKRWDGVYVCTHCGCWERRHPLDRPRQPKADDQTVPWVQPDPEYVFVEQQDLAANPVVSAEAFGLSNVLEGHRDLTGINGIASGESIAVPVVERQGYVLLLPDDVRICSYYADQDTNFENDTLSVRKFSYADWNHTLIKFPDLSSIPSSATIIAVEFRWRMANCDSNGRTHTFQMRRLLRQWVESEATWNRARSGVLWGEPGAAATSDRSTTVTLSMSIPPNPNTWMSFSGSQLVTDVQNIVNGTYANYGWRFERTDGQNDGDFRYFSQREFAGGQYSPILEVRYEL